MITKIDDKSFCNCRSLTEIQCANVSEIGMSAFSGCHNLKTVKSDNVSQIGRGSFVDCRQLSSLSVAENNQSFRFLTEDNRISSFGVVMLDKNRNSISWGSIPMCQEVVNVPTYVSSIEANAFSGCGNMRSFGASNISSIGNSAFRGCTNLTTVDFGQLLESVPSVAEDAFDGCENVVSCYIPRELSDAWFEDLTWRKISADSKIQLIPHDPCLYVGVRDEFGNVTQHRISIVRGLVHLSGNYLVDDEGNIISYEDITYLDGYDWLCVWIDDGVFDNSQYFTHINWGGYSGLGWGGGLYLGTGCWSSSFEYIDFSWTKPFPPSQITFQPRTSEVLLKVQSEYEDYVRTDPGWIQTKATGHWEIIWMPKVKMPFVYFQSLSSTGPYINHTTEHKMLVNPLSGDYSTGTQTGIQNCYYGDTVKNKDVVYVLGGPVCTCKEFSNDAFRDCDSLTCVNISSVNKVGSHVFDGCDTLKYALMPELSSISEFAFNDCGKLRLIEMQKARNVGNYGFNGCSSMVFVDIPEVTSIGTSAFGGCENLSYLNAGNLIRLDADSIDGCNLLQSMDCYNTLSIGEKCLSGRQFLQYVRLSNVVHVGDAAFAGCQMLSSLSVSEQNNSIVFMNEDNKLSNTGNVLIDSNRGIVVWCSVSRVNGNVYLPSNVTKVGEMAFDSASNVSCVDCFAVSSIGEYAFCNCISLSSLYFGSSLRNVPFITENSIDGCVYPVSVHVPYLSVETWKSTDPWNEMYEGNKISFVQTATVYLDLDGGTCDVDHLYATVGSQIGTLPHPKKTSYVFVGWFANKEASSAQIKETDIIRTDTTIYAKYVISKLTMQKVGNVVIDQNGIASGFSQNSYLVSNGEINFADNIQFVVKCKTGKDIASNQEVVGMYVAGSNLEFGVVSNKFMWEIATGLVTAGQNSCSAETEYWYKVTKDHNNIYNCYISYTTDEDDKYILDYGPKERRQLTIGRMMFGNGIDSTAEYWRGTIDLKQSYMEINGEKITFSY